MAKVELTKGTTRSLAKIDKLVSASLAAISLYATGEADKRAIGKAAKMLTTAATCCTKLRAKL
jgi:hypothetical protein